VGDLRFHAKVSLLGRGKLGVIKHKKVGLALDIGLSVPSGDEVNYAGENGIVFAPTAVVDFKNRLFYASYNVGVRLRSGDPAVLSDLRVGNQFLNSAAVTLHLLNEFLLLNAEINILEEIDDKTRYGFEFRGSIGTRPGNSHYVTIWLSGGAGFAGKNSPVLSVPQMRFLLGLTYAPSAENSFF
jgi:hypothetical protein